MELRPYQEESRKRVQEEWEKGPHYSNFITFAPNPAVAGCDC